ncbi:MAG: TrmH family RNA methyltransferase, partial [Candidatus Wallbacteria bacterium]|nr:TrmH family RNA methyltransferase [Candidatus Wallbacteria bacterium]
MIEFRTDLSGFTGEGKLNVVLFEPEIPPNAGNVARLCAATDSRLIMVGKLGFELSDRHLKRAGLDYWPKVELFHITSLDELWSAFPRERFHLVSTKAHTTHTSVRFHKGDFLVFGRESAGLPPEFLLNNLDRGIT